MFPARLPTTAALARCLPSTIGSGAASCRVQSLALGAGIAKLLTPRLTSAAISWRHHPARSTRAGQRIKHCTSGCKVRIRLKRLKKVRSNRRRDVYYYAWLGGPRIATDAAPGTPEFMQAYNEAIAKAKPPGTGKIFRSDNTTASPWFPTGDNRPFLLQFQFFGRFVTGSELDTGHQRFRMAGFPSVRLQSWPIRQGLP
jgi:hypothetical protein